MTENLINTAINNSVDMVAEKLFFRKLGICYDYLCGPGGFPSPHLPRSSDISQNLPDAKGTRTGMADSMFNNAFLFDALALRFEIGIACESEDRILDRLIGGAIRLATIGPKSGIINGLSPDGRSFYPDPGEDAFLLWAYYAWRICQSPVVAPESQMKLKNIASRWVGSLEGANFVPPAATEALGSANWFSTYYLPGVLASVSSITSEQKLMKKALEKMPQAAPEVPADATGRQLLACMVSVHLLLQTLQEQPLIDGLKAFELKLLAASDKLLTVWKENPCSEEAQIPDLDWRKQDEESGDTAAWARLQKETETLVTALEAACVVALCSDKEQMVQRAELLQEILSGVNWAGCWLAESLILSALLHARGVELQLWDKEIAEYRITFDTETTLVAKFMAEDYDELNPGLAGHTEAPKPVKQEEPSRNSREGSRRRRGNRSSGRKNNRPQEQNQSQDSSQSSSQSKTENKPENKEGAETKRPPRKRRRRRKKKPNS